jgi:predicted ester cyclase
MTTVNSQSAEGIVTEWVARFNSENGTALRDLCRDDVIVHAASPSPDSRVDGLQRVAALLQFYRDAVPDAQFAVVGIEPLTDRTRCRWVARGTNSGPLLGMPPTHKTVEATGTCHVRIVDGLIGELWFEVDLYGLLEQAGALLSEPGVVVHAADRVGRAAIEAVVAFLGGAAPAPVDRLAANLPVHMQCFNLRRADRGQPALEMVRGFLQTQVDDMRLSIDDWFGQGMTVIGRGRIAGAIAKRGRKRGTHRLYCMARIEGEQVAELWVRTGRPCHDVD